MCLVAALSILALAACTESDADRLDDWLAGADIDCGTFDLDGYQHFTSCGIPAADAEQLLACMNGALESGKRAKTVLADNVDDELSRYSTDVFTLEHQVRPFTDYPSGDNNNDGRLVFSGGTCTGPFRLVDSTVCAGNQDLVWDGCPN